MGLPELVTFKLEAFVGFSKPAPGVLQAEHISPSEPAWRCPSQDGLGLTEGGCRGVSRGRKEPAPGSGPSLRAGRAQSRPQRLPETAALWLPTPFWALQPQGWVPGKPPRHMVSERTSECVSKAGAFRKPPLETGLPPGHRFPFPASLRLCPRTRAATQLCPLQAWPAQRFLGSRGPGHLLCELHSKLILAFHSLRFSWF